MQNTEYADFTWEKCTLHVQPKAWRKFRLKGKSKKKCAKDRFIPIPAKLVWKVKERMRQRNAQSHDLVFPNGNGKPDGHFLRILKAIAKKTGIEGAELHRFRKCNGSRSLLWIFTRKFRVLSRIPSGSSFGFSTSFPVVTVG